VATLKEEEIINSNSLKVHKMEMAEHCHRHRRRHHRRVESTRSHPRNTHEPPRNHPGTTTIPSHHRLIGIAITSGADAIAIATATTTACAIQLPTSVGFGLSESLTGAPDYSTVWYIYTYIYVLLHWALLAGHTLFG